MKVRDLITVLEKSNPDAEVVIHRDNLNYGYGAIQYIRFGVFCNTDYGNDFVPDSNLIMSPSEQKALCFYAYDSEGFTKVQEVVNG